MESKKGGIAMDMTTSKLREDNNDADPAFYDRLAKGESLLPFTPLILVALPKANN